MNYRHAFHAGNFADVVKHVVLVRLLCHLRLKPAPFRVIDTHAGIGRYDLAGEEAERTGEWQGGIGRLAEPFSAPIEALLGPYREIVTATRARYGQTAYPGSPAIIRELLRPEDRAILVERHPADELSLRERYNTVRQVKVLHLDGWTALGALVPPKERRGLVLIDPPYEEPGELRRSVTSLKRALDRWPTGMFALWYPIKEPQEIDGFVSALGAALTRHTLRLEVVIAPPTRPPRLIGCGLVVVNPPWTLPEEARLLLPGLATRFGGQGGNARCEDIVSETGRRP